MVKSRFNATGICAIIFGILLAVVIPYIIYTQTSVVFFDSHAIPRGTLSPLETVIFICLFLAMLTLLFYALVNYIFAVKIDPDMQIISFTNIFTQKERIYNFNDFEGYFDTYAVTTKGSFKTLYFIQDKKAVRIIKGYYYSNLDDLQEHLIGMKYLGFQKDFKKCNRRAFFKKPLIN